MTTKNAEQQPGQALASAPPREVVLPTFYYVILVLEAAGLFTLYQLRPTFAGEPLGHSIGWIGTLSMCVMHVYSIRRRTSWFGTWGRLRNWLHFHIFLGLQGAMLVTFHSAHLQTWTNISGITLALTLIVVCSGIYGRYLFSFIPKSISGERLDARAVEQELAELHKMADKAPSEEVARALAECQPSTSLGGKVGFGALMKEDLRTRRALKALHRVLANAQQNGDPAMAQYAERTERRAGLARRLAALSAADRIFRNWTILHKPLTFLLLGWVVVHIASHYIFAAQFH